MIAPRHKHSVTLDGHRTSLSLEPLFWELLQLRAREEGKTLAAVVRAVDRARKMEEETLSAALRVSLAGWAARKAGLLIGEAGQPGASQKREERIPARDSFRQSS